MARDERTAATTRVRVDFRQVREALTAVDQASTVFEGLLVACVELQDENEQLRDALALIANREQPANYAVCLPDCVEGPPTCACAERRAHLALLGKDLPDA